MDRQWVGEGGQFGPHVRQFRRFRIEIDALRGRFNAGPPPTPPFETARNQDFYVSEKPHSGIGDGVHVVIYPARIIDMTGLVRKEFVAFNNGIRSFKNVCFRNFKGVCRFE